LLYAYRPGSLAAGAVIFHVSLPETVRYDSTDGGLVSKIRTRTDCAGIVINSDAWWFASWQSVKHFLHTLREKGIKKSIWRTNVQDRASTKLVDAAGMPFTGM
jgi:hypothetical protein